MCTCTFYRLRARPCDSRTAALQPLRPRSPRLRPLRATTALISSASARAEYMRCAAYRSQSVKLSAASVAAAPSPPHLLHRRRPLIRHRTTVLPPLYNRMRGHAKSCPPRPPLAPSYAVAHAKENLHVQLHAARAGSPFWDDVNVIPFRRRLPTRVYCVLTLDLIRCSKKV